MKARLLSCLSIAAAWVLGAGQSQPVSPSPGMVPTIVPASRYSGVLSDAAGGVPTYVAPLGWGILGGCPQMGYDQTVPNGDSFWLNVEPWQVGFDAVGFADVEGSYYPQITEWVRVSVRSLAAGPPFPGAELFEDLQHQNDGWFRFKTKPWSASGLSPSLIRFELAFDNPVTGDTNFWLGATYCYDFDVLRPIYRGIAADGTHGRWWHFPQLATVPLANQYHTPDGRPFRALFHLDPRQLDQSPGAQPWKEVEIALALPYTLEDRGRFWATFLSTQQIPNVTIKQVADLDGNGVPDYGGLSSEPTHPERHALAAWEISKTVAPARDIVLVTAGVHYEPPGNLVAEGFIREVVAHPEWLDHVSFVFIPVVNPDAYEWGLTHVAPYGNNARPEAPNTLCDLDGWWRQYDFARYGFGALADPEAQSLHAYLSNLTRRVDSRIVAHVDLHTDLCPHPNRWTAAQSQPPPIYGYVGCNADLDQERAQELITLLAPPAAEPVPAWNRFSWPYYRRLEVPQAWTTWRYADYAFWQSYFAKYAIPLHITFEYDEVALYRDRALPKPSYIQTPLIENHGGYAVDGYIDEVGRQVGGSDTYVYENWGRELAQAVRRVFGRPKELWEDWDTQSDTNGWYQYTGGDVGSAISWRAQGGVDNSAFAFCDLAALEAWPQGSLLFYSLNTFSQWHAVDLRVTPSVTVSINTTPLGTGLAADLKGGALRFFVGQWNSEQEYAFYAFGGARFDVVQDGWVRSTVTVNDRPADWMLLREPQGPARRVIPLASILPNPQQWGCVVVGASSPPTAWLGFDDLRVARRFAHERWDWPTDVNGWVFYDGTAEEPQVQWSSNRGVTDSGYAWCPLDQLADWPYTPGALYPLAAFGGVTNHALHPVDLLDRNLVALNLNPACVIDGVAAPRAVLQGGALNFWVGEWHSQTDYAFYRYTREAFQAGGNTWTGNRITLTRHPADWQLAGAPGPTRIKSLEAILADPQQWGIGLFGASGPPTGVLGFDLLAIQCQAHNWNKEYDRNAWSYYTGFDPDPPPSWQGQGGWGNSGFVVCPLDALRPAALTGTGRYYPLYTLADRQKVNLHEKPGITVALNLTPPGRTPADLRGALTFFVGQWDDDAHYVFYFLKDAFVLSGSPGWLLTKVRLTADPADWDSVGQGTPSHPLIELLKNPQQWGLAIVDATGQPTGWLGFDQLEICPLPAPALVARITSGTVLEISVGGSAHGCVQLQSADALSDHTRWVPRAVLDLDAAGTAIWREPIAFDAPQRYFRLLPEP